MTINLKGLGINYIDEGAGDCVLLLHGWGAHTGLYAPIIDNLKGRYRVLAPNMPGVGGSDEPKSPMELGDYEDFAVDFCQALGVSPEIAIGHSHGGRILLSMLSADRPRLPIKKCVLIDSAGLVPKRSLKYHVKVNSFKAAKAFFSLPPLKRAFPEAVEKARAAFGSADYSGASQVMRQTLVKVVNVDLRHRLGKIRAETLLIWGENDRDTPLSDGRLMESLIPSSGLVVLKGAGHYSFIDCRGQFSAVLDSFLP